MKHDFTIEEIKANHYSNVSKAVDPFLADKLTSEGVQSLETQMKKRIITHTYESLRKQKRHVSPSHLK
jgi:hypothetical protein